MPKQDFIRELSHALARTGWPTTHARRLVQETSDHWDDLESEARETGLDTTAATAFAGERIGKPAVLVQAHQRRMRDTHWSGRHPVWSFAVAPPMMIVLWFLVWARLALEAFAMYSNLFGLHLMGSHLLVLFWASIIHYTGVLAVPAIGWWWAQRSFCGRKWGWIACGACSLHGLFNHVTIRTDSLQWAYGWAAPDWMTVVAPLMVGAIAHGYKRPGLAKMAAVIISVALATGCASSKQPQERGWIGGEYNKAPAGLRGVLITRLSTNTPAARSGLHEGDLITRVDGQRIGHPETFFKALDVATPGSRLSMEICRDGKNIQHSVLVGKELFRPDRNIVVGLLLSREWDLWPNPGFSLVALGYKRHEYRIELDSPESRLTLDRRRDVCQDTSPGLRSREGWEAWLPVCSFSSRKRILAQTAFE